MENTQKKHIVFLTDNLHDPDAGGAERKIYELAAQLSKADFKISIASLYCESSAAAQSITAMGSALFVFPVKRIYGLSGWIEGIKFLRFLKEERVDILQTYHFASDIWGTFWARRAGVRKIISNRRDMGFWRGPRHIQMYRLINRWVDKIVVVSQAVKDVVMREEGVAENKIDVIYNGVDLSATPDRPPADRVKEMLGIGKSEPVIMHVANFKEIKGHKFLLEAFAGVIKRFPDARLVLIGEDELQGTLQRRAGELGVLEKTLFLGKRNDVRRLLSTADICVLPSLSEGMSNAILEYMDAGKPVVATRVGGNPETVVDGQTGILVEPKDAKGLAGALERLLKNTDVRLAMGDAARRRAEEIFDIRKMFRRYEELFRCI